VFYNVFQGGSGRKCTKTTCGASEKLTASIVREQLSTMRSSHAFGQGLNLSSIFIGPKNSSVTAMLECPTCHLLEHLQEGSEHVTLQHLYDHCLQHRSERVVYMHSKASFHASEWNNQIRRFLMRGIWSNSCHSQEMFEKCTACGSRFSPMPHHHYPGNMWVARCDYVARLFPPLKFQSAMATVERAASKNGILKNAHRSEPILGLGRYSAEHWLSSHPSHAPCDVCGETRYLHSLRDIMKRELRLGHKRFAVDWVPKLHAIPRPDLPLMPFCKLGCSPFCNVTRLMSWRNFEWKALYPENDQQGAS